MISNILKAKHWQLFLLTFGLPFLFQFFIMGYFVTTIDVASSQEIDPTVFFDLFKFIPIIIILFSVVLYSWFWSVAIGLQAKIPESIKMKVNRFKIFFFIPLVYLLLLSFLLMFFFYNHATITSSEPNVKFIFISISIILPIHLFSIFCNIHTLYFVAKTFKTVELQKEVTFSDFVGEFFMIWFYPIGIWILQPKINKITEENLKPLE